MSKVIHIEIARMNYGDVTKFRVKIGDINKSTEASHISIEEVIDEIKDAIMELK